MSLNPNDSRRRGRSKSPGRRRDDEDEPRRERSRVRAPSPPSKYAYEDEPPRGKGYGYDDYDRERREVVDVEPRGYGYDARDSRDPRDYPASSGRPEYGTTSSYGRDARKENVDEYAMPGAFTSAEEDRPRYVTTSSSGKREKDKYKDNLAYEPREKKEKDYYKDLAYGDEPYDKKEKDRDGRYGKESKYGDTLYGSGEKDRYGRGTSPAPPNRKERGKYDDERSEYDKYGRATSPLPPSRKERGRYEDDAPPKKDKYGRDTSPLPSRKSKYDKDEDSRYSGRYEDDKYKYAGAEARDEKLYNDDGYQKGKYETDTKHGRERGESYTVPAGAYARSTGVVRPHEPEKSSYMRPPSPTDFAPPGGLGRPPQTSAAAPISPVPAYAQGQQYPYAQLVQQQPYAQVDQSVPYTSQASPYAPNPAYAPSAPQYGAPPAAYQTDPRYQQPPQPVYGSDPRYPQSQIVTVEPGQRNSTLGAPASSGSYRREPSPGPGLNRGMHSLSVSSGHHGSASLSLATAPGSPLLESYHGTYQSISPMPSPLMIASTAHNDVDIVHALEPDSSSDEDSASGGRRKKKRNARFHDPSEEAQILAQALKGDRRAPDVEPLIEILPGLTHDQVLDLRAEYKKIVKTGSEKKGVNIAKHIKSRLKEEDPSLMKACYACALGKWESEAYWSNFWYQGEKSRRELLIESLMGRSNREIREIKDGFADKKYSDSLVKCMKTELKEDKFKKAVLLVLEEKKMEERPGYPVDRHLVDDDVRDLYKAVKSEKGGESAMINIIVVRSDEHLREVLRVYEATYRANFPREMLKKSGNLVGELLAHILNGVINKPVRDALLINHALSLSKSDSIRTELLISRLVRYHWDRPHMEAVKREYRTRYGIDMRKAVVQGTRGDWGHFCEMLCVTRMGDETRRLDEFRR